MSTMDIKEADALREVMLKVAEDLGDLGGEMPTWTRGDRNLQLKVFTCAVMLREAATRGANHKTIQARKAGAAAKGTEYID